MMNRKKMFVISTVIMVAALFFYRNQKESAQSVQSAPQADDAVISANPQGIVSLPAVDATVKPGRDETSLRVSAPTPDKRTDSVSSLVGSNYVETFKGLDTRAWYFRSLDPTLVIEAEKRSLARDHKHSDGRLTLLIDLKKKYWLAIRTNENYKALLSLFETTDIESVAFLKGQEVPLEEISKISPATPICLVRFNRARDIRLVDGYPNLAFEDAQVVEYEPGIKGVRVNTLIDPAKKMASFIKYFECFVRQSEPGDESYRQLSLLHWVATAGIDGTLFGEAIR